jgi:heptosyltransferase-3
MSSLLRYAGQDLEPHSHIVVLGSCKVGNFVVSTPVLRGLRYRFPMATIGFIGSAITSDFESAHPALDWRLSWDESSSEPGLHLMQQISQFLSLHGPVQLVVNLDGFNPVTCVLAALILPKFVAGGCLTANRRSQLPWGELPQQRFLEDTDWDSPSFLERNSDWLGSNYISELFCHLAFVSEYVDPEFIDLPSEKPNFLVPDLLIHCTTARPAKMWSFDYWHRVVDFASSNGWTVGLIGSTPSAQRNAYNSGDGEDVLLATTSLQDLRGRTTLIQLAGACRSAKAVISVDAGPLHIAAAVGTPTLAVVGNDQNGVGASPIRLWMPRGENVTRTVSAITCSLCSEHRFRNSDCLVDDHPCMESVHPDQVIQWLRQFMQFPI